MALSVRVGCTLVPSGWPHGIPKVRQRFMRMLLAFVPLVTLVVLPSVFVKIAALLSRARLSWKHCFIFGSAVAFLAIGSRATSWLTGQALPVPLAIVFGSTIQLALGSWYFSSRGEDKAGKPVGLRGGLRLMIVYLLLLAFLAGSAVALASALRGIPQE